MFDDDENRIWSIAELAASQVAAPHWGEVKSYNPSDHTATVLIHHGPDITTLSADLPIKINGHRYAPKVGDMAFLVPESQDSQALVINGFAYNDLNRPPVTPNAIGGSSAPLKPGEWEGLGPRGTNLRLAGDGSLFLKSKTGHNVDARITSKGDVDHDGNVTNTKNTSVGTGYTGSVTTSTGEIMTFFNGILINVD